VWRALPDGKRQPLLASAALVDDGAEVVHSLRDITKLVEADEAKTVFLATTSHELKTPLTVINGFASTLLRQPDIDPGTREVALTAIHRRAQELSKIVDRLLMSSRIEAGRLSLAVEQVNVAELVRDRVLPVPAATGRDVVLDVTDAPDAYANADAVATVVDHLVDNALKYAPDGQVRVAVGADGGAVVLRVRDDGVGMDAEQAEHCFDKFWQADASDARQFGGTGIGLYIVRSLVEAMGGTIEVRSALGAGSEFAVRLASVEPVIALPDQRAPEASMIREFMRQIGVASDRSAP
jgi:signal transduction histidine kinase